ncbi:hypothetical protein B0H14DRAFT_2629822 [Mycena olivaceomarginata]|nr:hypothetical protein B0H14DRAFT_2629822 [Mycena olivaceomarginata]
MYGASAHWLYGNFSGTNTSGCSGGGGGSNDDGQFDGCNSEQCLSWSPSRQESRLRLLCTSFENVPDPTTPRRHHYIQPGKAPKCAKKGGEKELNLDWELVAGGKHGRLSLRCLPLVINEWGKFMDLLTRRAERESHATVKYTSTNQTGLKLLLRTQVRGMIWVNGNEGTHPVRESSQSLRRFLMHIVDPGGLWDTRHTGRTHLRRGMRV